MMYKRVSPKQIKNFDAKDLPLIVLSDNLRSVVSAMIKSHEKGCYSHFMWMHRPSFVATQDWWFHEKPIDFFFEHHRLKFWTCETWTVVDRQKIKDEINRFLNLPLWRRFYDPLQIVGKWVGLDWLQIPGIRICSDYAGVLNQTDPKWISQRHLSPKEVNRELQRRAIYKVFGRYTPD